MGPVFDVSGTELSKGTPRRFGTLGANPNSSVTLSCFGYVSVQPLVRSISLSSLSVVSIAGHVGNRAINPYSKVRRRRRTRVSIFNWVSMVISSGSPVILFDFSSKLDFSCTQLIDFCTRLSIVLI